jgi:hypothetical protein
MIRRLLLSLGLTVVAGFVVRSVQPDIARYLKIRAM